MFPLLTANQMRQCDQYTIEQPGNSSRILMERAAHAAVDVLKEEFSVSFRTHIFVLCGKGNNGGDGFAMARFLFEEGYHVTVCYGGSRNGSIPDTTRMSVECAAQYSLWTAAGGKTVDDLPPLPAQDVIVVDALFGIGLDHPIHGQMSAWIEAVNAGVERGGTTVLSLDIPSGVCADTGKVLGTAVRATVTATIAFPKPGLLLHPGAAYAGKIKVCPIGVSTQVLGSSVCLWQVTPHDLTPILSRPAYANKGTFGRVLIVGGFLGMSGAAYFAAKSAYRAGAGLVEIMSAEINRIPLQTLLPEAIFTAIDPAALPDDEALSTVLDRADAVVFGCGLGQSPAAASLAEQTFRLCRKPLVVDADGLNLLASHQPLQVLLQARKHPTVLTPHLGEASRLTGHSVQEIANDLISAAVHLAESYGAVCVLKDTRTIVSDSQTQYMQDRGNSGMATGGSGDCLAGVLASLFAQHRTRTDLTPSHLCALGVLLHAMAGDIAAERLGKHAVMASDIADAVGQALHCPL